MTIDASSWAARSQVDIVPGEADLHELARFRHPRVAWWWGVVNDPPSKVAFCYLCDEEIARWSSAWPMPVGSKVLVADHRAFELRRRAIPAWPERVGTSPALALPEGEPDHVNE